jgi:hypothetical protein
VNKPLPSPPAEGWLSTQPEIKGTLAPVVARSPRPDSHGNVSYIAAWAWYALIFRKWLANIADKWSLPAAIFPDRIEG